MKGKSFFLFRSANQLCRIFGNGPCTEQIFEERAHCRQLPADRTSCVLLVESSEPAPDKKMIYCCKLIVFAMLFDNEVTKLGKVGLVGGQGMRRNVALGSKVTEKLIDFLYHGTIL